MAENKRAALLITGGSQIGADAKWSDVAKRLKGLIEATARSHPQGLDVMCGMRPGCELVAGRAAIAAAEAGSDVRLVLCEREGETPLEPSGQRMPKGQVDFGRVTQNVIAGAHERMPWSSAREALDGRSAALLVIDADTAHPSAESVHANALHEFVRDGRPAFSLDLQNLSSPLTRLSAQAAPEHIRVEHIPRALVTEPEDGTDTRLVSLVDEKTQGTLRVTVDRDALTPTEDGRYFDLETDAAALLAHDTHDARTVPPTTVADLMPATFEALARRGAVVRKAADVCQTAWEPAERVHALYDACVMTNDLSEVVTLADDMRRLTETMREAPEKEVPEVGNADAYGRMPVSKNGETTTLDALAQDAVERNLSLMERKVQLAELERAEATSKAFALFLKDANETMILARVVNERLDAYQDEPERIAEDAELLAVAKKVEHNCETLTNLLRDKGLAPLEDGTMNETSPTLAHAFEATYPDENMTPEGLIDAMASASDVMRLVTGIEAEKDATPEPESKADEPKTDERTVEEQSEAAWSEREDAATVEATEQAQEAWSEREADEAHENREREVIARGEASMESEEHMLRERDVRIESTIWTDAAGEKVLGGSILTVDGEPVSLTNDPRLATMAPHETLVPTSADRDALAYLAENDLVAAEKMEGPAAMRLAINLEALLQRENSGVTEMLERAQALEDERNAQPQMPQANAEKSVEAVRENTTEASPTQDEENLTLN